MKKYWIFALLGYTIGVLYAPKKGSTLRLEIKDCFGSMQAQGKSTLAIVRCKGLKISEKTSSVLQMAKTETEALRFKSEKMIQHATQNFHQACDKSSRALQRAHERVASKAARRLVG